MSQTIKRRGIRYNLPIGARFIPEPGILRWLWGWVRSALLRIVVEVRK